ncbi:nucleotide pyrophosphohydrolase [Mucisphaera calidilacus]|uniref:MazG nucleotide pyrophosphohydrolase domain protein n=1 Tax=Mucisphaera calidilacus TaxID=2527982 RepID=A0A518BTE5_9BACT|nr:nucleotide pyrophosphohydrolase [Mucisphaera calidilacus]QDU70243.1 MazG nucleotide pyrophosphohydrolase domain protein [Mucisphaera calidilacus]
MDDRVTVSALKERVSRFVLERDWGRYHQPKNLAMSVAIEAAELMELFQWDPHENPVRPQNEAERRERVREEMSDVLAYLLSLAAVMEIDVSEAFEAKMASNEERYPASGPGGETGAAER